MIKLSTNLLLLRRVHQISQLGLASLLGVPVRTINNYENATAEPDIDKLRKLGALFDVSLQTLLTEDISNDHRLLIRNAKVGSSPTHSIEASTAHRLTQTIMLCQLAIEGMEVMGRRFDRLSAGDEKKKVTKILGIIRSLVSISFALIASMRQHRG